jgi:hypothetical protein
LCRTRDASKAARCAPDATFHEPAALQAQIAAIRKMSSVLISLWKSNGEKIWEIPPIMTMND